MTIAGIRDHWQRGGILRNAWLTIPDPYLAEIVASSEHVEAVTIDMQHGLFDRRSAVECIRAIGALGAAPFVRLPTHDDTLAGYLLDAAALGLILPGTSDSADAESFVAATRFPPAGNRSHGPSRAPLAGINVLTNDAITIAMIESASGLDSLAAIAAVTDLDGIYVGPADLGISLGLGPGQDRMEAEMVATLQKIREVTRNAGKIVGIHANSADYAADMAMSGFQFVTVWVDAVIVNQSLARVGAATNKLLKP